jgi:lysophospholipase L1-like esterase
MFRRVSIPRRIIALFSLTCLLLLSSVSPALAAPDSKPQQSDNQNQNQEQKQNQNQDQNQNQPTILQLSQQLPVTRYLALGDSLAYGFQPNDDHTHGYVDDLFTTLHNQGVTDHTNLGCPRETTSTFIAGGKCSYPSQSQLATALAYLQHQPAGQATLVTLDIGANDVLDDITINLQNKTCVVDVNKFKTDLQTLDKNLTKTILPRLQAALINQNGQITGILALLNYYDPFQNVCPNTLPFIQTLNTHLASDVKGLGTLVDILGAFGGTTTPNPNLCNYTWTCSAPPLGPDIHPTTTGYQVMAHAIEGSSQASQDQGSSQASQDQGLLQTLKVLLGCKTGKECKGSKDD